MAEELFGDEESISNEVEPETKPFSSGPRSILSGFRKPRKWPSVKKAKVEIGDWQIYALHYFWFWYGERLISLTQASQINDIGLGIGLDIGVDVNVHVGVGVGVGRD